MKIILASGNAHKVAEFRHLARISGLPLTIEPAQSVGGMPAVVEDAGTFVGNASKKARALAARLPAGTWALADDSGLCVDHLGGAPGVESAYYAGPQGDPAANLAKLIEVMRAVPPAARTAHFVCVLALEGADGRQWTFEGRCDGSLRQTPCGGSGFGYDPLFVPAGCAETFAEMADAEKNQLSHRARAWAKFVAWVRQYPTLVP